MVMINRRTLRLRPDVADGASEEALSLPQQLSQSDQVAVPQHQTALVAIQEMIEVCGGVSEKYRLLAVEKCNGASQAN
jgi:hypothetical protein